MSILVVGVKGPYSPSWVWTMGDGGAGATGGDGVNKSHVLFDNFVQATTCKGTLKAFQELCEHLEVKPSEHRIFYHKLKSKLNYWKAKALWAKLDKRACQKEYKKGRACANTKVSFITGNLTIPVKLHRWLLFPVRGSRTTKCNLPRLRLM
ncbi:Protein-methionine sulfoxide oxidase mical3a [Goodea atripinnis]|uniref:Protein-methionine sulfoxide oxidase mical3a n=1 Tax=Goodea atripinnis TaxID=208336 RepID=A0ABV0N4I9_9TELE